MFAREDALENVGAQSITCCINSSSNPVPADLRAINSRLDHFYKASFPFPLRLHCLMIGQNGVTTAESPVCEVRNSGETGSVLEMQRWLCDHHARRELGVLAAILPSDDSTDEDETILDTKRLTNSSEVRDASWEEGSSPLSCMS